MPIINGVHRSVTINEWISGFTTDGIPLDIKTSNGYRLNRGLSPHAQTKPFKLDPPKQLTTTQLVGDALTALLKEYGLAAKSTCSCKSWAGKLNEWGVAGCREHRAEIVAHLAEAYHSSTWWDTFRAAGSAVYHSLPLTLGGLVDEAIRRTETSPGN